MSVFIHTNGAEATVFSHLRTIVTDPGLSARLTSSSIPNPDGGPPIAVVGDGMVSFSTPAPLVLDVGSLVLRWLVDQPDLHVLIRGEETTFEYTPGNKLIAAGGVTSPLTMVGATRMMQVIYDVTGCKTTGTAMGYWVVDGTGKQIPFPFDVILFHELIHAYRRANGTRDPADPEGQVVKVSPSENDYRSLRSMPLRATSVADVHKGGGNCVLPAAPPPPKVTPPKSGCFVATAAFGNELEPEVELLRQFRDQVLLSSRTGAAFFERFHAHYYSFSPPIAEAMRQDPEMARTLRIALVEPITHFLDIVLHTPDVPLNDVPEPWGSFLSYQRELIARWADQIELPTDFSDMSPEAVTTELSMLLRYVLRSEGRRERYLDALQQRGVLPLPAEGAVAAALEAKLRDAGRSSAEIARVLSKKGSSELPDAAFGVDESPNIPQQNPNEWFYTVTLSNSTQIAANPGDQPIPIALDFRVFYKRRNLPGIVYKEALNVPPTGVAVIVMGVCSQMESYAFGAWGYVEVNGQLVYERVVASSDFGLGDLTPQKVSQLKPSDTEPCADSWEFTS